MKLKPVVASLVMLGLMSPALANSGVATQQAIVDQNSVISPVCTDGWFNRITIGGIGSVVAIHGDQDQPGTFGTYADNHSFQDTGAASDMFVNNFNLLVNAHLSSWSKATLNLAYLGAPKSYLKTESSSDFTNNKRYIDHRIVADEAYVTIANFAKYPFYLTFGKKYVPFGDYNDAYVPFQIMSPAQMFAQTNGVTAVAGAATDFGFYASLFAFRGENVTDASPYSGKINNFGAKIGYYDHLDAFNVPNAHINLAASYINNIMDSQYLSANTYNKQYSSDKIGTIGDRKVNAVSLHADLSYKAFSMYADWVGALRNMLKSDAYTDSSKLWGANVNAAYAFKTLDQNSSIGAGFQWSGNGDFLVKGKANSILAGYNSLDTVIPKWRFVTNYKVNLFKNTDLELTYAHGKSYELPKSAGVAERRSSNVGLARLMVQF